MATIFSEGPCVLCGSPASYRQSDRGNSRDYTCNNDNCGNYEISKRAIVEIEKDNEFKRQVSEMVRTSMKTKNFLKVIYDIEKGLTSHLIPLAKKV